tara:strand:- start:291 stop:2399 length:2109 start_codon:yes stop_codon:yes gene_type:complete
MENSQYNFSVYKAPIKNIIPVRKFSLENIHRIIISEKYKEVTKELRNTNNKANRNIIKASKLDYVTFSGLFEKRALSSLKTHSNLFCIDLDDLNNVEQVKKNVIDVLPPALIFISPSGNGLKLVYKITVNDTLTHLKYFQAFEQFFKIELDLIIDEKCKDIPRACFLCYDEKAYYNGESKVLDNSFIDTFFENKNTPQHNTTIDESNIIIENLKKWINKKESFINGNRNNYITQLAGAYNRYGINKTEAENDLLNYTQSDFAASEIRATIKSIYNNTSYHNTASFDNNEFKDVEVEKKKEVKSTPLIPIDDFPEYIQNFIYEYIDVYKIPRDYITASVIFSTAFAIGNKLELNGKYDNIPLLWLALVGNVSSGKTDPLKTCLSYFTEKDSNSFKEYKMQLDASDLYESLSKKEKENEEPVPEAFYFQYLLNDYTPEALYKAHTINNRGICIYRDELKGWLDDFGRYSKSGEQSTMLSTYYRQPMQINRASKEPINIEKPSIYVGGGIQPEILKDLAKDSRAENGFLSRIMFAYPDLDKKQHYSNKKMNTETLNDYHKYLNSLTNIKEVINLSLSDEAEAIYCKWFNMNVDITNDEPRGYLKGVYGKLDVISLRLAIVIHGMDFVCNEYSSNEITAKSMQTAINLTEYFRATALKVYDKIFIGDVPEMNKKDVAKFCKSLGASQNDIGKAIKTSQQYVAKLLR